MSVRKFLAVSLTVIMLVFSLVALNGVADAAAKTVRIGVVTPDADHGFTGESVAHARAELEKLGKARGFQYKFEVGGEADVQIAAIESILQWGPDVIVLWPLEGGLLKNTAQRIKDAGVGLIIYDRLIDGFTPTAEIMGDNETIGKWMGNYLLKFFAKDLSAGKTISYLRFIGDSSTVSIQRSGGMDGVIKSAKFKQVQSDYKTDWSNATAQEQMENWLNTASPSAISGLDLIVTHDDEIVDGIVVALKNYQAGNPAAKLNVRLITSVGGKRETLATFDKPGANGINLVTYNFSPSMVREAVRLGVAAAYKEKYNKRDVKGLFLISSIEIDKTNVAKFRSSQGFIERYSLSK